MLRTSRPVIAVGANLEDERAAAQAAHHGCETMANDEILKQYEVGAVRLRGEDDYDRHLVFDHVVSLEDADQRERFEAVARSLRDVLTQRWLLTQQDARPGQPQAGLLPVDGVPDRPVAGQQHHRTWRRAAGRDDLRSEAPGLAEVHREEPDAGLGNGGLGRLAACFIDSLATLQIPAIGYGLRYEYGIFRQEIENGYQVEQPDHWLRRPDPWEVARPEETVQVPLGCSVRGGERLICASCADHPTCLLGVPYDRPVVGYGGQTINTLRLWEAASPDDFDFGEFSSGDFFGAVVDRIAAETVTRVLYPDDSTQRRAGAALRAGVLPRRCSLADIVARFRREQRLAGACPTRSPIQLNDTHPAMAVAELMRILLDEADSAGTRPGT